MKIYAVKDMQAGIFLQPNAQKSEADAKRQWAILANDADSMISRFPNDFRLYQLAEFHVETGELTVLKHPIDLGSAAEFKQKSGQTTLPFPKNVARLKRSK